MAGHKVKPVQRSRGHKTGASHQRRLSLGSQGLRVKEKKRLALLLVEKVGILASQKLMLLVAKWGGKLEGTGIPGLVSTRQGYQSIRARKGLFLTQSPLPTVSPFTTQAVSEGLLLLTSDATVDHHHIIRSPPKSIKAEGVLEERWGHPKSRILPRTDPPKYPSSSHRIKPLVPLSEEANN